MISHQLCKEYPGLTPFIIENTRFNEVIQLYADIRRMQIREHKQKDPNRVIRRPAGDDWF